MFRTHSIILCKPQIFNFHRFVMLVYQIIKNAKRAQKYLMLKISHLVVLLKFFHKKVAIMFGQFAESVYLCIRNREGHPFRAHKERVL